MTKEKIYQELTKALAIKGVDVPALLALQADIKADLLNEATTASKGGSKAKTAVINGIIKEAKTFINYDESKREKYNFMLNSLKVNDYQVFSTNYRFIATTEHTQHDTNEAPERMKRTYLNLIREAEEAPQNCYKYNRVNLPTAAEMKAYLKIIKATHRTKYGKAPENYIVSIEDKIYLNLEYLIEAIEATGSNELYYNAETTSRGTSIINNNTIASIMPTRARTDKVISELDLLKYDLFINEMTGKATITDREMFSDKTETETA